MPRSRICLFLAVACLGGIPVATAASAPEVRVLRVKAVADEVFREREGWREEIREDVRWGDAKLRELAGIGLDLTAVEPWTTHGGSSMMLLLSELRAGVDKDGADAVIGFTGHPPPASMMLLRGHPVRYPLPFTGGIALPLGDRVVIRRTAVETLTRHTLIHEVIHLFGGLHVDEESILETYTPRMSFRLDSFNERVLELTRRRDFDIAVPQMPRDQLAALVELYRQAPLREREDPDTVIRLAYLQLLIDEVEEALQGFRRAMEIAPERTRDILRSAIVPELEDWAAKREPGVRTRYLLGRAHFLAENWLEASVQLLPSCDAPYEDPASCALLGAVYLKSGRPGLARRPLRTALRKDDTLAEAYSTLASVSMAEGRYDEALELFARALELDPDDVDTQFNTGLAYLSANNPGAAQASFRKVLRLGGPRDDARAKLALSLARQGLGDEARKLIEPFEEREVLSAVILRDMAEICFLSGDTKEAFRYLRLAKRGGIDVEPIETLIQAGDRTPPLVGVGELIEQAAAYYRTARYDTARELLDRARELKPDDPGIHYWLGRVTVEENHEEEGRAHFRRALELDPDHVRASYELGRLAYLDQDYATAVSFLEPYVEGAEAGSAALFMLGRSHFELGHLEEARNHLEQSIRRSSDGNSFYFLARVLLEEGRDDQARRELELAIDSRSLPDFRREDAHLRLARLLEAAGESREAEDHVDAVLALSAAETTSPAGDLGAPRTDRVELVQVTPSLTKTLARGQEVDIAFTVHYDLWSAERGTVFLAPQDDRGATLVWPQPRAAIRRGQGEVTLQARITPPADGAFVDVFLALHAGDRRSTTAVTRARYTLE